MLGRLLASLTAGTLVLFSRDIYHLIKETTRPFFSHLKELPGPKGKWLLGNVQELMGPDPTQVYQKWVEDHGHVFVFKSLFGVRSSTALSPVSAHAYAP
jgi:hypothetical protein